MRAPRLVQGLTMQDAYLNALAALKEEHWDAFNLVVQVEDPTAFDDAIHARIVKLAKDCEVKTPKQVASTIFPESQRLSSHDSAQLYDRYLTRYFPQYKKHMPNGSWGSYFARLINYGRGSTTVNQLGELIDAIRKSDKVWRATHVMVVPYPGAETRRQRGGPCLHYITVQLEPGNPRRVSLLAVYRNHTFVERAYGNYWGLSNLLRFIASETGYEVGRLTCVSSHAEVEKCHPAVTGLLSEYGL